MVYNAQARLLSGVCMEISEFKRILEIGLGRAVLYLQTHDAAPYREVILDACLHDTRYDHQTENRRSTYLFDVIQCTSIQAFFREKIIQASKNAADPNGSDALQLNGLLTRLARQGDHEARQLIYDAFVAHLTSDEWGDMERANDLMVLDGTDGFLFAAERFGALLPQAGERESFYEFPWKEADWDADERAYWEAVTRRAADNPHLAAYVAFEQDRRASRTTEPPRRPPLSRVSYDQVKQAIAHNSRDYSVTAWGKFASEAELELAAADLLALDPQENVVLLREYLDIFRQRRFPLNPQKLIELASAALQGPDYDEDGHLTPSSRLVIAALNALAHIHHPKVRQLAFDLIEGRQWIWHTVGLLTSNWQESDWAVLEALSRETFEPFEYHALGLDVRAVFKAHPSPAAVPALINFYEHGPCSACRERIVQALHSIQRVPDWMRAECRYDANLDLREWAGRPGGEENPPPGTP
jgi:hypothetical protein